jgi:hypothetical protein
MGCSFKAIDEDEEDWERLQKENNLPREWKVYGREYYFARQLHRNKGYKDRQLKLAVRHAIELENLQLQHAKEWRELEQLLTLEDKYA